MFVGIGNLKVRRLFKKARVMSDKYGGSVIFIDEIDAVGSRGGVTTDRSGDPSTHRIIMGGMGMGGGMGVINELLVQMDGFTVPRGLWRHVRRIAFRAAEGALLQHPHDRGDEPRRDLGRRARPSGTIRPQDPRRTSRRRGGGKTSWSTTWPRSGTSRSTTPSSLG